MTKMKRRYFADLFENKGNAGNAGKQVSEASNNAASNHSALVTHSHTVRVIRVTHAKPVTQVTPTKTERVTRENTHQASNDGGSVEWLHALPTLPEKTGESVNDQPIRVKVWAPSGVMMITKADSPEHAEWLRRMNPPTNAGPVKPESVTSKHQKLASQAGVNRHD